MAWLVFWLPKVRSPKGYFRSHRQTDTQTQARAQARAHAKRNQQVLSAVEGFLTVDPLLVAGT